MSNVKQMAGLREIKKMLTQEGASFVSWKMSHNGFQIVYEISGNLFKAVMDNPAKANHQNTRLMLAGIRSNKRKALTSQGNVSWGCTPPNTGLIKSGKSTPNLPRWQSGRSK